MFDDSESFAWVVLIILAILALVFFPFSYILIIIFGGIGFVAAGLGIAHLFGNDDLSRIIERLKPNKRVERSYETIKPADRKKSQLISPIEFHKEKIRERIRKDFPREVQRRLIVKITESAIRQIEIAKESKDYSPNLERELKAYANELIREIQRGNSKALLS